MGKFLGHVGEWVVYLLVCVVGVLAARWLILLQWQN